MTRCWWSPTAAPGCAWTHWSTRPWRRRTPREHPPREKRSKFVRASGWCPIAPPISKLGAKFARTVPHSCAQVPWWRKYGPPVPRLTPTCVWRISPELVLALQDRFGDPVDAYVNGSQVWLRDDGPGGLTVEWRLHPVAGYEQPDGVDTYDVFTSTSLALARGADPPTPVH